MNGSPSSQNWIICHPSAQHFPDFYGIHTKTEWEKREGGGERERERGRESERERERERVGEKKSKIVSFIN